MTASILGFTENDHWELGIGDPTVVGWVTVGAYFIAAVLCWACARRYWKLQGPERNVGRFYWTTFTIALVLLGINKQLDLQTWFTLFGKHLALSEGWYEKRRTFQATFIGAVALSGAASLIGLRVLISRASSPMRWALFGGVFLVCFVIIRAASFHHVDQMLGFDF